MKKYNHGDMPEFLYYTGLLLCPIRLLYSSIIIYTYWKVKRFRKKPGDLFVMIAITAIIVSFYELINSLNS